MKKTFLVFIVVAILWGVLASLDAGVLGVGVILSVLAFLDIVTGEFKDNSKMVWLIVALFSLLVGVIGIAFKESSVSAGDNPAYTLSAVFSLLLPLAYFTVGRKNRFQNEKK